MIPETHLLLRAFARLPLDLAADRPQADPAPEATPDLIAHILERYHETHRRELPEVIDMARKVEQVHAGARACPAGLADHLAMIRFPIDRMMAEHRDVDVQLAHLAALTHGFTAPHDACRTWRELYRLCRKIDDDLREHMRLENEVLFARFI